MMAPVPDAAGSDDHINRRIVTVIGWLGLALGLLAMGTGLGMLLRQADLLLHGERVEGEVIEMVRSNFGGDIVWTPRVRFTDRRAEALVFDSQLTSMARTLEPGDPVPVLYPSGRPHEAIHGDPLMWFFPSLALLVGAGFSGVSLWLLAGQRRRTNA